MSLGYLRRITLEVVSEQYGQVTSFFFIRVHYFGVERENLFNQLLFSLWARAEDE